ncbi:Folylpolyglutamate synthetase [Linderina macrospora]|uniref:Folylpolyglutamate synthetase n=1 Tax=Linderina macrospora TaxID=4868 RepID=A0ACC1JHZ0_9FUNG|nr:Folylpolyglutamate synthetase [Linderina macrospora]
MSTETYTDLNNLQTNFQIIQQIKASGGRLNEYSIPEFASFIEKIGHKVSDLDRLNVIHVTGTKGKGSTCAFVSSLLSGQMEAGNKLKIGLFTSPHLIEVRERIQINGQPISTDQFAKYFYQVYNGLKAEEPKLKRVMPESPDMPMYFRFLTLMAYHTFLQENVDVAIMEVGVGGQYDSTNVIQKPIVCGIASLGIDHQGSLGNTIEEIAWHKAGIMKQGAPAYSVEQPESALQVLEARAKERHTTVEVVRPLDHSVELGIPGEHQAINAALAVRLCQEWAARTNTKFASASWITDGLRTARWPGRSQTFVSPRHANISYNVDGAHTVESMAACGKWFASKASDIPCVLVFNAAHERNARALLETLWNETKGCKFVAAVFCPNLSNRVDSVNFTVENDQELRQQKESAKIWKELSGVEDTTVCGTINEAVECVEERFGKQPAGETNILVAGSLHLVGGFLDVAKGSI